MRRHAALQAALTFAFIACLGKAQSAQTENPSEVTFTDYSPLSSNAEMARRLWSPLKGVRLQKLLAGGAKLRDQAIDLSQEKFVLYVPPRMPAAGYGLIVFVAPWNEARVPDGWSSVLDQYGMILVAAARSGNDQSALARREPLALLAETNVAQRYRLDSARIVIAGFSGGSLMALRLALGYPDVFRGAILNAGGDPIGDATLPLPPRDLFARFQDMTHLVYFTGDQDIKNIAFDVASRHSLRDWCVFHVDQRTMLGGGHDPLDGPALSRALDILAEPLDVDSSRLAECRAAIDSQLNAKLADVSALIAAGKNADAKQALDDIDAHYGGLAAPQTVELATRIGAP
jgi:pimeloyl-ACP methyl ester carboxylesterase